MDNNPTETAPVKPDRGASYKRQLPLKGSDVGAELIRRVPPHNAEAEIAVLAGVLLRPEAINSIADLLVPEDFYLPAHAAIFRAYLSLFTRNAPIDMVTVAEELRASGDLENAGGTVYLIQLSQAVVSGANASYYAGLVRAKALQRKLIDACAEVIGKCFDASQPIDSLLDESEQAIFSVASRNASADITYGKQLISKVFENLSLMATNKELVTGVTTGFERLDRLTSGLQRSDLIIIAARPSMGKTAFALCLALNAAIGKKVPVAIFSLEMSKEQLAHRMLSIRSKVDLSKLRRPGSLTDDDWRDLYGAADAISGSPIFIDDTPSLSTMELRARARRLKAEHGLGLIVVDYLQLMRSSRRTDSRELEISDISRSLKALAKELDIPVVALAQLNRKVEERTDKRPILADLRESGAIEQDADVIMFVYREDVYKVKNPADRPQEGVAEIIIGKQRNGPVGVADLVYLSPYTSFESRANEFLPSEAL